MGKEKDEKMKTDRVFSVYRKNKGNGAMLL